MRQRETSAASGIATRLRITTQSLDHGFVARKVVGMKRGAMPGEPVSEDAAGESSTSDE